MVLVRHPALDRDTIIDCKAVFKHVENHMTTSVAVLSLKGSYSNATVTENNQV